MKVEVGGLKFRIGLRWKITGLIVLLLGLVMVGIKYRAVNRMQEALIQESISSGEVVLSAMVRPAGDLLIPSLDLKTPIEELDRTTLNSLAKDAIKKSGGKVVETFLIDSHDRVLAFDQQGLTQDQWTALDKKIVGKKFQEPYRLTLWTSASSEADTKISKVVDKNRLVIHKPIVVYKKNVGLARIVLDLDPIYKKVDETVHEILVVLAFILLIGVGAAFTLAHFLIIPINLLVKGTIEMTKGHFAVRVPLKSHDELGDLTLSFNHMAEGLEQREKMKTAFGKMVSKDVFGEMMDDLDNVKVRGEKKHISILFSDVRGFTSHSEKMKPEEVTALLNEYFEEMVAIVLKNHGTLDKFIGDGLMALFGAPKSYGNDAVNAVQAALEMRKAVEGLNQKWESEGKTVIKIGVGVNTGEVTAGFMGSTKKMEYSVIGDAVNLASRIEGLNKDFNTITLMSEFTYQEVKDHFEVRELEPVKVKGKEQAVNIYEILSRKPVPTPVT